jgi:hypothetical protein
VSLAPLGLMSCGLFQRSTFSYHLSIAHSAGSIAAIRAAEQVFCQKAEGLFFSERS